MFREPLIVPLSGFITGILLAHSALFTIRELVIAAALFSLLAVAAKLHGSRITAVAACLLAMIAAGALCDVMARPEPSPELESGEGEVLILAGCVVQPPVLTVDREQFVLELEPGARANVSLALREGEKAPHLEYGQRIEFDARMRRPRNFENPGSFDYVRYLARQRIYWTASARASAPIRTLPGRCGSRLDSIIFRLRVAALERIERLYAGDDYATAMMEAILIGEPGKLEKVWTEHFRRTGTFHALVISGMHIVVLAGTVLVLLRLLFVPEMAALTLAAAGAWVYAAVSGWSAPVVRAAGGFTLFLAGRYIFRRGRVLNLLAGIALVYLAWDPGQLFEASFQLSFLCVASIGAFSVPLIARVLRRYRDAGRDLGDPARDIHCQPTAAEFRIELRLLAETAALWTRIPQRFLLKLFEWGARAGTWTVEMVILSAVIQVSLALPMALYFHRISITGLTANLVVVPLLNALVPVGFAAIFTGWKPLAIVAHWLLRAAKAADWHIHFEPARRVPDPPFWLALALTTALVLVAVAVRTKSRWLYAALPSTLVLFGLMLGAPFPAEVAHGSLELTAIDVGQGDGLLLTTPQGRVVLIDTGGLPAYGRKRGSQIDIGEDVISPYLWTRRIQHADVIATTHAHEDHVGGLAALIANFRPSEIWTGAVGEHSLESASLDAARRNGIRVTARMGGESFEFGGARFEVLAPAPGHIVDRRAPNNDSLAFEVRYGQHSFLLTGDMERQVEWDLVRRGALDRITVLKVAHHGSRTSSTPEFLQATQPQFAIISVGRDSLFHHPSPDVVERLTRGHTDVLRTDRGGLVTIRTDGRRLSVMSSLPDPGHRRFSEPFQAW